ncbi:TPA: OmpA family protein [Klebsiella quasipneumoniae subsp. quasipneumoniae]|nr:OmpA family protein [Klebsiella quasipneumoniae subsp. quasipneumoniae]HCI6763168.1 OmpA family protein [Klebsiella quasipneumoniae subsp. quasipneumoniae]
MRDNARRLLTILTVILALWLALGFWPLSIGNQVIFSLCILLAGSAALWRQRRRAVSRQRPEIVLPPEDFQGAVVLVCGDTDGLFPGRSAHCETRLGWYLRGDSAEQLPRLAQYLAAARPALVSQVSVLLAVLPEHHTTGEHLVQSLCDWRRSIVQCRTWLNGLPPVWSVFWVTPPGGQAAESRWFTVTPDRPGLQVRQKGQASQSIADWQREGSSASRLHHTLWLESILALAENVLFRPFRARQAELPPLNLCAVGICLTPMVAGANNLWQQQIAGITTLSPGNAAAPGPHPLPDLLLSSLPHRHGVSRRMRAAGLAAGVGFLFLALAMLASFINNQRLVRSVGDHLAVYYRLSGTPPMPKLQAQQRLRTDSRQLDDWLRRGEPLRYRLGLYQGLRLIPFVEAAINDWAPPPPPRPVIKQVVQGPQTIRLDSMALFDTGKSTLKPGSTKLLVNSLLGIKAKPGWLIVVAGHTDSIGNDRSNQQLSLKRAEAVRDWMRDTGDVPESCFAVQGYGESRPVASNETPDGRAQNRRVEISLVPQKDACLTPGTANTSGAGAAALKNETE